MKVAVLCESSGIVRDAFIKRGHDAVSCDLLPTESSGPHIQGDCTDCDWSGFDLLICHPTCTYLCNSGVRWLHSDPSRWEKMREGARFFRWMLDLPCDQIAVENPVMHKYAVEIVGRRQDFTVQPWQFGDDFKKRTCFWTNGLPRLIPTSSLNGSTAVASCHNEPPGPDQWKNRSRTYQGIAGAIAEQWSNI